ncbi:McrC family protein [Brevibacillus sp. NRS-1366]|uniref:McrC family protein n=1 Tax=Brevibacillus sp. NRS-1366 TaxID=3233899 RepID=UPI003D258355
MKTLTVHECVDHIQITQEDKLYSITRDDAEELDAYFKSRYPNKEYLQWSRDQVSFLNVVGYIQLTNVAIEILPKVNISGDLKHARSMLLHMLERSAFLQVSYSHVAHLDISDNNLYEIYASLFASLLEKELRSGLQSQYVEHEDNKFILKGSLVIKEQLKNKMQRNNKVYCKYEEFTANHLLNQILKAAIHVALPNIRNTNTIKKLKKCSLVMAEIELIPVHTDQLKNLRFNRTNQRFEPCLLLAKLFLEQQTTNMASGVQKGYSILFPMEELFEQYIAVMLKRIIPTYKVHIQHRKYRLLLNEQRNTAVYPLLPDVVIEIDGKEQVVIDTKWKRIKSGVHRHRVKREDLFQMYAYANRYEDVSHTILVYPYNEFLIGNAGEILESWLIEGAPTKRIQMCSIDLSSEKTVRNSLLAMLHELNILPSSCIWQEKNAEFGNYFVHSLARLKFHNFNGGKEHAEGDSSLL